MRKTNTILISKQNSFLTKQHDFLIIFINYSHVVSINDLLGSLQEVVISIDDTSIIRFFRITRSSVVEDIVVSLFYSNTQQNTYIRIGKVLVGRKGVQKLNSIIIILTIASFFINIEVGGGHNRRGGGVASYTVHKQKGVIRSVGSASKSQ